MDLKNVCRLCATGLATKDLLELSNKTLLSFVQEILRIDVNENDHYSTKYCSKCEDTIIAFQLFILDCNRAQKTLKELYLKQPFAEVQVKQEEQDVVYVIPKQEDVKNELAAQDFVNAIEGIETNSFSEVEPLNNFENAIDDDDDIFNDISLAQLKTLKKQAVDDTILLNPKECRGLTLNDFCEMKCHICNEKLKNWFELNDHCKGFHNAVPIVKCLCGYTSSRREVLYQHISTHQYNDDLSNEKTDAILKNDLKPTDLFDFRCFMCEKVFHRYTKLETHAKRVHKCAAKVTCSCGQVIKSRAALYKHVSDHRNPEIYRCEICQKLTKTFQAHQKHVQKHVQSKVQVCKTTGLFKCDTCDKTFKQKELLKSHVRMHIPIEDRKTFECDVCNFKFTTRSSMLTHKRVRHEKYKGFVCDLCGFSCGTSGELRQHRAIHSEDKPFSCPKCAKTFKTHSNLKTHLDTHADTSYQCYICQRVLNSRRTLRKHLLVHQTDCHHVCSYCNKAFKRRQTLKVHMSIHTGDKPISCKWCSEKFSYASTLRLHRLRYHADKMAAPTGQDCQSYEAPLTEENHKINVNLLMAKINDPENVMISENVH